MGGLRLSKEERETLIITSEADDYYSIYTFNGELRRKLKRYAAKHPDLCWVDDDDQMFGCSSFSILKSQLSLRLLEPYSDERHKAAVENGKKTGYKKRTEQGGTTG